jgi:hypothetical protein
VPHQKPGGHWTLKPYSLLVYFCSLSSAHLTSVSLADVGEPLGSGEAVRAGLAGDPAVAVTSLCLVMGKFATVVAFVIAAVALEGACGRPMSPAPQALSYVGLR